MFKPNSNIMKKQYLFSILLLLTIVQLFGQQTFPRNGVYDDRDGAYAFTNATIHTKFDRKIENATLIIRKGKVEAVGAGLTVPKGMVSIDLTGKHIYPSFVDIYSGYGVPEAEGQSRGSGRRTQQMVSNKSGAYMWNQALQPEFRTHEHFTVDEKAAKSYRGIGFGVVSAHRMDGMSRGTATVVTLGEDRPHKLILQERSAHHLSFKKGSSTQSYPGSLMGGIALFRQTYLDGEWYKKQKEETNISLAAWNNVQSLPQIFETREILESLRAINLGKEQNLKYIIYGHGDEYQRLEKIKKAGNTFILNLNFPEAFDVEAPYDALRVELGDMKHWELAPTNPGVLAQNGVDIILTSHGLKDKKSFLKNLRKAIESGLTEEQALKALTQSPAKALNIYDQVGSLEKGKLANFFIASDEIFEENTKIHHHWIQGKPFIFSNPNAPKVAGKYDLKVGNKTYQLEAEDDATMKIVINDSTNVKVKSSIQNEIINLSFQPDAEVAERVSLTGVFSKDLWSGNGTARDGSWTKWSAIKNGDLEEKEEKKDKEKKDKMAADSEMGVVIYPFMAFGNEKLPETETVLIRNATVWTNEDDGILENADVLFSNGKIKAVGESLPAAGATVIDGTGKHVTCGVIDEHSHIAISRGVNECTQVSTAEVSIGDVVDSEDIDIYRQLAGGVTTSQLLHGSCNPIGGKSAIIKLRWGYAPEEMKMENSPGFIKFALGENVKKSRSSSNNRFPDTRMGVEQVYVDAFTRAKEYRKKRNQPGFRKDLDMETLLEIMDGKRHISCHSYVQSEINMLMHVADDMGFKINTFTHILEGYKVADKMKAHGAGGSSFSDWWAYKYEVIDAIPYNGALMHEQGVTVAFNSDDAEMARRLNQEAAKAVKYGQVSEEDAWKFVTLNPAKLLHIDDRVGSIKTGKDADIVVWSDHPMSIYAKAEQTFIDGIRFFDRNEDEKKQLAVQQERTRLINKMLEVKKGGGKTRPVSGKMHRHYHCDDAQDEMHD